jgi:hypothetical protein
VREFESDHISHTGRDFKVLRAKLWWFRPFYEPRPVPADAPAAFVREHKGLRGYAEGLKEVKAAVDDCKLRADAKEAALRLAKEGDFWWWVWDVPTGFLAVPALYEAQALARTRMIFADRIAATRTQGKMWLEQLAEKSMRNPLADRMAKYGDDWKAQWMADAGRWNGQANDPPLEGDRPRNPVVPPLKLAAGKPKILKLSRSKK